MGWLDWLLEKKEQPKARKYLVRTRSGSEYEVERQEDGVWILYRKGPQRIVQIGSKQADNVIELSQRNKGNVILFASKKGIGNISAIESVQEIAA